MSVVPSPPDDQQQPLPSVGLPLGLPPMPGAAPEAEPIEWIGGPFAPYDPGPLEGLPSWLRESLKRGEEGQAPKYPAGVERSLLRAMPVEQLRVLQEQLMLLGWASDIVYGEIDNQTVSAFNQLLAAANARREDWRVTLDRAVESRNRQIAEDEAEAEAEAAAEAALEPGVVDVYRPPDYTTIAQNVKTMMRDMLGRDPTDAEMTLLGTEMSELFRQQFDDDVAAFDMQADEMEEGRSATRVLEGPTKIDPILAFRQRMEEKYAGEIEAVETAEERQVGNTGAELATSTLSELVEDEG